MLQLQTTSTSSITNNNNNNNNNKTNKNKNNKYNLSPLSVPQVRKAAVALLKHLSNETKSRIHTAKSNNQPVPLFLEDDDQFISLIINLKKIPDKKTAIIPKRIGIPHSLYKDTDSQLCIFVKESQQKKIKDLFASQGVPVNKVIGLKKLRTRYKSFESRRELCHKYQLFLADNRIMASLPPLLGKYFFRRKKQPVPVKFSKKDMAAQVRKARDSTYLFLNAGSCCAIKVGRSNFEVEELVENTVAAANGAASVLPKRWNGIQSIHIKATNSIALPIFNSLPDAPLRIIINPPSIPKKLEIKSQKKSEETDNEPTEVKEEDAGSEEEIKMEVEEVLQSNQQQKQKQKKEKSEKQVVKDKI